MTIPRLLILAAAATVLAGCASLGRDDARVCDGRHRRPANPHGSTLVPAPAPAQPQPPAPRRRPRALCPPLASARWSTACCSRSEATATADATS